MSAGPRSEQAYDEVKRVLTSGAIAPGRRLDPIRIAERVSVGVTPVREALLRLTGERIVEIRKNTGFHLPVVTEAILAELYRWNFEVLRMAISLPEWPAGDQPSGQLPHAVHAVATLFTTIAERSGGEEVAIQIASANDRLTAAREAEATVLGETRREIEEIASALGDKKNTLIMHLRRYHGRRLACARQVVTALYKIASDPAP